MKPISDRERLWTRIRRLLLDGHESVYADLTRADEGRDEGEPPAVKHVSYEDFCDLTSGDDGGPLTFQSETPERLLLSYRREELVELGPLFYGAWWGTGLKFTRNEALGMVWYEEISYSKGEPYYRKEKQIAHHAARHTNDPDLAAWLESVAANAENDGRLLRGRHYSFLASVEHLEKEGKLIRPEGTP